MTGQAIVRLARRNTPDVCYDPLNSKEHKVKHVWSTVVLMVALASGIALAQTSREQASRERVVVANDPSLNAIVAPDARLDVLKGDYFGLLARPVWVRDGQQGYLLFSDVAANAIYKWTPDGMVSKFLDHSGYTGKQQGTVGAIVSNGQFSVVFNGSSGLMLDEQGRLLIAATADRNVVRIEKNGTRTVLADRYDGMRFSSPIEIAAKSDGSLYITDGTAGLRNRTTDPTLEIPFEGVYLLKDGKVVLLDNDRKSLPSGITLTPDGKTLVVGSNRKIIAYETSRPDAKPDRQPQNDRRLDGQQEPNWGPRIGVVVVRRAATCSRPAPEGIWIIGPDGKHLGTIRMPEGIVQQLAFGDNDGHGLSISPAGAA